MILNDAILSYSSEQFAASTTFDPLLWEEHNLKQFEMSAMELTQHDAVSTLPGSHLSVYTPGLGEAIYG